MPSFLFLSSLTYAHPLGTWSFVTHVSSGSHSPLPFAQFLVYWVLSLVGSSWASTSCWPSWALSIFGVGYRGSGPAGKCLWQQSPPPAAGACWWWPSSLWKLFFLFRFSCTLELRPLACAMSFRRLCTIVRTPVACVFGIMALTWLLSCAGLPASTLTSDALAGRSCMLCSNNR